MSDEIYAPPTVNPQAEVSLDPTVGQVAARGSRLGASILDSIIMAVIILPIAFLLDVFQGIMVGESPSILLSIGISLLGIVIFFAINFKFLVNDGQTIGKKIVGIQIVSTSATPLGLPALLKRYGFYFLIGQIPFVGNVLSIINVCFIFRKESKCLHDDIAKTQVFKYR